MITLLWIFCNKILRFIAENPRFVRYVLDNYNPDNPEQVKNNGHVDVPIRELQKLEESRIKLFDFINESWRKTIKPIA